MKGQGMRNFCVLNLKKKFTHNALSMFTRRLFSSGLLCLLMAAIPLHAQIGTRVLNRAQRALEDKIEQKVEDAIERKVDQAIEDIFGFSPSESEPSPSAPSSSGKPNRAQGLTETDVPQHLADARSALAEPDYSSTRHELQQAILGIELRIGHQILTSLPTSIMGMEVLEDRDQVHTSGVNFTGLTISRSYDSRDMAMNIGIANNSTLMGIYTNALRTGYGSDEESYKSVRLQGEDGALYFDEGSGNYELGIPLGNNTIVVMTFEGFETEAQVMSAANEVDLVMIKEKLNEQ